MQTFIQLGDHTSISVVWASLQSRSESGSGLEHLVLHSRLADSVVLDNDSADKAFRLHYRIEWDESWCTRQVDVRCDAGGYSRRLLLFADGRGRWWNEDETEMEQFLGCLDVDLWPTPFTNTLAIRRLRLQPGDRQEISVVYIEAPRLALSRETQAYSRITAQPLSYLFESVGSDFKAELKVDHLGLVVDYPGLFTRVQELERADAADDKFQGS